MKKTTKKSKKPSLAVRLKNIKALVLDCDGILTDTKIYYMGQGAWSRSFSIRDGFGLRKLQDAGIIVSVITTSKSEDITERMRHLKIDRFYDGAVDKTVAWTDFLKQNNLKDSDVAYMGDDDPDMPLLQKAGVAFSVSDAMPEIKKIADFIPKRPAGQGAVREVAELILARRATTKKGH